VEFFHTKTATNRTATTFGCNFYPAAAVNFKKLKEKGG